MLYPTKARCAIVQVISLRRRIGTDTIGASRVTRLRILLCKVWEEASEVPAKPLMMVTSLMDILHAGLPLSSIR